MQLNSVNANASKISWNRKNAGDVKHLNTSSLNGIRRPGCKRMDNRVVLPKKPKTISRKVPQIRELTNYEKQFFEKYKTITIEGIVINKSTTELYRLYKKYLAYKKAKNWDSLTWDKYLKDKLTNTTIKKFKTFVKENLGLDYNSLSKEQLNNLFKSKSFKKYTGKKNYYFVRKNTSIPKTGTKTTALSKITRNGYRPTKSSVWG